MTLKAGFVSLSDIFKAIQNAYYRFNRVDWCNNYPDICKPARKRYNCCDGCIAYNELKGVYLNLKRGKEVR